MSDALTEQNSNYANLVQSQIAERKAKVDAETKAFLEQQERKRAEELKANIDYEAQAKRDNEQAKIQEWNELSLGMNEVQKALLKEWLGVASQLASSQQQIGYKDTKKLKARYDALLKEIVKDGRNLGTTTFRPFTVYLSNTGLIMLPNDSGKYRLFRGSFNAINLPIGEKDIEFDSETGLPTKLFRYGHLAKSNIPIKEYFNVDIEEKTGDSDILTKPVIKPHKPIFGVTLRKEKGSEKL